MNFYSIKFKNFKNNIFISLIDSSGSLILVRSMKSLKLYKETKRFSFHKFSFKVLNSFILDFFNDVYNYDSSGFYSLYIHSNNNFFINNLRYNFIRRSKLRSFRILLIKPQNIHGFMREKKLRRK